MQFADFKLSEILPRGLSCWDKMSIAALKGKTAANFKTAIDAMAIASAKAQKLKTSISTVGRLIVSDYRLYVITDDAGEKLMGILKIGKKHLYVVDPSGQLVETDAVCVMDFYVHESVQRQGVGSRLFHLMLERENLGPHQLALDRPSPKLLPFMERHFALTTYTPQSNHFVLFHEYFKDSSNTAATRTKTVAPY